MFEIKVNDNSNWRISMENDHLTLNDETMNWDMQRLPNGTFHILANGKSYHALLSGIDYKNKRLSFLINGNTYHLSIQEPIDLILKKMGLNLNQKKKTESIKAPMPGLILKILVEENQSLKKGDPILILEAMKMENVFKAPADSIVKFIKVQEGQAVEKGAILIELS